MTMLKTGISLLFILALAIFSPAFAQTKGEKNKSKLNKALLADQVRAEFRHAWNGYKKYAWGHDDLKPLSKTYHDWYPQPLLMTAVDALDRKSTRLNSSHANISYAVFCLKKHTRQINFYPFPLDRKSIRLNT